MLSTLLFNNALADLSVLHPSVKELDPEGVCSSAELASRLFNLYCNASEMQKEER